jgi:hypothetical protein
MEEKEVMIFRIEFCGGMNQLKKWQRQPRIESSSSFSDKNSP